MNIRYFYVLLLISFYLPSCSSLSPVQLRDSAEEVVRDRSSEHVVGYQTYYMGSDESYDYYRTDQLIPQLYKTKTVGAALYPHAYPFKGWGGERYTCQVYRGRILVTPLEEQKKLRDFYKNTVQSICQAEYERLAGMDADEQTRKKAKRATMKMCLRLLNDWTIQHWGQDRLDIPYLDQRSEAIDWHIIFDWSHQRPEYRSYSFTSWHEDIRF